MDIFEATKNSDYDRVKELLDNGKDVNIVDKNNNTPLHYACQSNNIKIIRLLILRGANINSLNNKKVSPLSYACFCKKLEIAKLLLEENNANVNIVDDYGNTLLHDVCNKSFVINDKLIELVISYGIDDFTVKNNREKTPLYYLRESGKDDLIKKYKDYESNRKLIKAAKKKK